MNKETIRKMFLASEDDFYSSLDDVDTYKEIIKREELAEELLINSIDHNAFHLFDEVCSIRNELSAFYVEEAYLKGFSDSTKLREEALRDIK